MLYVIKKNNLYFTEVKIKPAERYERSEPRVTFLFNKKYRDAKLFMSLDRVNKIAKHLRADVYLLDGIKEVLVENDS